MGARLARRLAADGWEVYAPEKDAPELVARRLGVVFYCAGLTADFEARPVDTVEAHAALIGRVIAAGRFERLVYLSSTRLYDGLATAEAEEAEPLIFEVTDRRRVFDLSKALGETLTLTRAGGRGRVARLSNVYDWEPGAAGFLSDWLIRARSERRITLDSNPDVTRDYIHLDDVVEALIAIAAAEAPVIFNVASGELASNRDIAEVFAAAGWSVVFSGDARPPAPPKVSIARLRALGFAPRPVKAVVRGYLEALP